MDCVHTIQPGVPRQLLGNVEKGLQHVAGNFGCGQKVAHFYGLQVPLLGALFSERIDLELCPSWWESRDVKAALASANKSRNEMMRGWRDGNPASGRVASQCPGQENNIMESGSAPSGSKGFDKLLEYTCQLWGALGRDVASTYTIR